MGGLRLIATFGWFLEIVAASAAITGLAALALDEPASARVFFATAVLMAFVATGLVVGFRGRGAPSRRRHGLALVLASWVILPAFAALPFIALAGTGMISGYFEAVSVFTTTGSTALGSIDQIPRALILWRAELEWLGGALTIVMAAAAVSVSGDVGQGGIHLLSSGLANVERLKTIARVILPVYALLTAVCFTALSLSGLASFDAIALALSTISTGGAVPHDGDISKYQLPALAPVMCLFMILGAANFALLANPRGTANWLVVNGATIIMRTAMVLTVFAILTITFTSYADEAEVSGGRVVFEAIFTTVSLITTSAFVYDTDVAAGAPLALIVSVVIVGGAYGSTAGGLKIGRVSRMIGDASRELEILIHPSVVIGSRQGRRGTEPHRMLWSYLIAYLLTVVLVALAALAGSDIGFEAALLAAAGSIANAGPVVDFLTPTGSADVVYASLSTPVKALLSIAMIAGRIEILAVFAVLTPLFWTR